MDYIGPQTCTKHCFPRCKLYDSRMSYDCSRSVVIVSYLCPRLSVKSLRWITFRLLLYPEVHRRESWLKYRRWCPNLWTVGYFIYVQILTWVNNFLEINAIIAQSLMTPVDIRPHSTRAALSSQRLPSFIINGAAGTCSQFEDSSARFSAGYFGCAGIGNTDICTPLHDQTVKINIISITGWQYSS